ncbi:MAG: D-2-hydroxyacid dehydrogenase [Prevotellaceae bacterium]|jgi:glycerate dehydrogenase|nr:D-2-hydroxyacid dehydrogenase [Prevotellaceae bacterium]
MHIVFLDADTIGKDIALTPLESLGNLTIYSTTLVHETIERIKAADIVITNKVAVGQIEMDAAPLLKLICVAATGTNNINIQYAAEKGITIKNVAGYSTESVVQTTFANILSLLNGTAYFDQYVKSGAYSTSMIFTHYGQTFWELAGKRFGIIGLGTIGKRVAKVSTAFGAEVMYYSTSGKNTDTLYPRLELDELLRSCDIISIHAPLNEQSRNLITLEKLKLMKPTAIIANMGRGGIINEQDLVKAIDENLIGGAVIDVYEQEPIPANHPYLSVKDKAKFQFTPHLAWGSVDARKRLIALTAKNIEEFLSR